MEYELNRSMLEWMTSTLTLPGRIISLCMDVVTSRFNEIDEYDFDGTVFPIHSASILALLESFICWPVLESAVVVVPCRYGYTNDLWFSVDLGDGSEDNSYCMRLPPWMLA